MTSADLHIDLGVLTHEPEDVYHAKAGEFLSSHLLADFRKSPLLYYKRRLGLIDDIDRPRRPVYFPQLHSRRRRLAIGTVPGGAAA